MMKKNVLEIATDGACSGNPGQMGLGVVISENGRVVRRISKPAGFGTNNRAEYLAIILALKEALKLGADSVKITSDSQLVIMQITGKYRIKSDELRKLKEEADSLAKKFREVKFRWVGREENFMADALAKAASMML
ncbi:ribonuclease H [Candidatus Woesearchaeota archaeon CG07_land_8_20_14_0_80_44_23]|nr:MAG: ribonuclease H [Candidatus Woesearchaeota archaeon CG07_land_8_20_14_0_80_44_23]